MSASAPDRELTLDPADNGRLAALCGPLDEHLRQVEERLGVSVHRRGNRFRIAGQRVAEAARVLEQLYARAAGGVTPADVHLAIQEAGMATADGGPVAADEVSVHTHRGQIRGRGSNQSLYLAQIRQADLTFGIGPAGTGKTYLAVACAVEALQADRVRHSCGPTVGVPGHSTT